MNAPFDEGMKGRDDALLTPLDHALAYAASGIAVFPCVNNPADLERHKKPHTPHGFKDATTDEATIRGWWRRHPTALIGAPTGFENGFNTLDLDVKNGKNGFAHVPDWEKLSPVRMRTGSGGAQLFFRDDGTIRGTSDKIAIGVDTRGDGGYTILPGSPGYEWIGESRDLKNLPPWPESYRPKGEQAREQRQRPRHHEAANTPPPAWLAKRIEAHGGGMGLSDNPNDNLGPATLEDIAAALDAIPNGDLGWDDWNVIGMAIWAATEGSEEGRALFHRFSARNEAAYVPDRATQRRVKATDSADGRWDHYSRSPPRDLSAGKLFWLADEADKERGDGRSWRDKLQQDKVSESDESAKAGKARSGDDELETVKASDVFIKAIEWLWEYYLAIGALLLITGDPNLGKSQILIWIIARVTRGDNWPDGTKNKRGPMNVILLASEDDLRDTVNPRLVAAGADLSRVHVIKSVIRKNKERGWFTLSEDIAKLRRKIDSIGDVALIAIDPITAYMGGGSKLDSHKATDVRSVLSPFVAMAQDKRVALAATTHPSKSAGPKAMNHYQGSGAFVQQARFARICLPQIGEDEEETGLKLFAPVKWNTVDEKNVATLAYRIEGVPVGEDPDTGEVITAPRIKWEGRVDTTADEAVADVSRNLDGRSRGSDEVRRYLIGLLANGQPMRRSEIVERAKDERGFTLKQLHRAKDKIGTIIATSHVEGEDRYWTWQLTL